MIYIRIIIQTYLCKDDSSYDVKYITTTYMQTT